MKLRTRIFLAFLAVIGLGLFYPLQWLAKTAAVYYREGVEDVLADQANIMAALVEDEMRDFPAERWREIFSRVRSRALEAQIYRFKKEGVDAQIYITDREGRVIFDSEFPLNAGRDFSRWRDVALTLKGRYGARASRRFEGHNNFSVLHVAAPIYMDGQVAGVLTVVKPTTNIIYFMAGARLDILKIGLLSLTAAGFLSFLITSWLTRPLKRLTSYAQSVRDGQNPVLPDLGRNELGEMGLALAEMREALEGRRYVEQYVEHLTHELKSPLSAIRGAAELLGEPMEESRRLRFLDNISNQSRRIQEIVDRMLELAALESRAYQRADEEVAPAGLARGAALSVEPLMKARNLNLSLEVPELPAISGDGFLLGQALANLMLNAIDFSPDGGLISLALSREDSWIYFRVDDQGPSLPDFARAKVFDKFFSLSRPGGGQKSTGLGLNFVRQTAWLHGGWVSLDNREEGGARAVLALPVAGG